MSTRTTFEQRALAAGASLRAAFGEDDPVTSTGTTLHLAPDGEQPAAFAPRPRRPRRRAAVIAAGLAAGAVAAGAITVAGLGDEPAPPGPPAAPEPSDRTLEGLPELPDFPLTLTVSGQLVELGADTGTRAFRLRDGDRDGGGILISGVRAIVGHPGPGLPSDLPAFLDARPDVVVSDVGTRTVDGVQGQSFRLRPEGTAPRTDIWCPVEEPLCFKLAPDSAMVMDVVVVPTSAEPLWMAVEYVPESRAELVDAYDELLAGAQID